MRHSSQKSRLWAKGIRNKNSGTADPDGNERKMNTGRLTWTTEKPKQSGWYWLREPALPLMGVIVQVDVEADTVRSSGTTADASLDQMQGEEWFGPLQTPGLRNSPAPGLSGSLLKACVKLDSTSASNEIHSL